MRTRLRGDADLNQPGPRGDDYAAHSTLAFLTVSPVPIPYPAGFGGDYNCDGIISGVDALHADRQCVQHTERNHPATVTSSLIADGCDYQRCGNALIKTAEMYYVLPPSMSLRDNIRKTPACAVVCRRCSRRRRSASPQRGLSDEAGPTRIPPSARRHRYFIGVYSALTGRGGSSLIRLLSESLSAQLCGEISVGSFTASNRQWPEEVFDGLFDFLGQS